MLAAGHPDPKVTSQTGLPVVPGAVDVVWRTTGGTPSVGYEVRESYPAPQTIRQLVDAMASGGWKLLEAGGFKSAWPRPADMPARSAGASQHWPTHFWQGRWRRDDREAVFTLQYSCPMESAGMHSVWVSISGRILGPEEAAREEAARKRIREECQAGLTVSPICEK